MSRCFPFPPPGYEKKAIIDDVDLLKKEKHREKKHKKEKKVKEKREDKDRKEKDKSDGKHRDRKDRKEKSKEKKKEKEREKHKDKTSSSQEKILPAQAETCNGDHKGREQIKDQNIVSNEKKQNTPLHSSIGVKPLEKSLFDEGVMNKFVLDLCSRIEDEEKRPASQSMERNPFIGRTNHERMVKKETGIMPLEKEKSKDRKADDIRKMEGQQGVRVGETISATKLVQNIVGRHNVENKGVHDSGGFQNRSEGIPRVGANISATKQVQNTVGKEKIDNQGAYLRGGFQNGTEENPKVATFNATKLVQNSVGKDIIGNQGVHVRGGFQNRGEDNPRILENSYETRDKNHKKESEDKRGSKRTSKDKEKKSHRKDKERDKERKKEEKAREKSLQKIKDHDKVKGVIQNGYVVSQNTKLPPLVSDSEKNLYIGKNVQSPQLVPNGDSNLILGQNRKLPTFVPSDVDKNIISHNTKLPQLVSDGDRNHFFAQNTKSPSFASDGDKNSVIRQNIKSQQLVLDGDRNLILGHNTNFPPSIQDVDRPSAMEGSLKKRKVTEANGFLHETNLVPNKKPRPTPHPLMKNGRKLELCQDPVLYTPERKVPPPNNLIKANNTEHKINGKIEVQPVSTSVKKPSSPSSSSSSSKTKADQISQVHPVKPPHPDTKYLSEVLSVPKIEEWCDFDDEEWLFSSKDSVSLSAGPATKASETPVVWAEAMQIESADVCALPYVIPY